MGIYVLSGGPGTGKSSVLAELQKRSFKVLREAAREIGMKDERFRDRVLLKVSEKISFQDTIFEFQKREFLLYGDSKEIIFSDRGFGDTLAYYPIDSIDIPLDKIEFSLRNRYKGVFVFDFLENYETDEFRKESRNEQERIHREIIKMYSSLGYKIIFVPFMSVKERADFIIDKIESMN